MRKHLLKNGLKYLAATTVVFILFGIYFWTVNQFEKSSDYIQYFGFVAAVAALLLNAMDTMQSRISAEHSNVTFDWNRRSLTASTLMDNNEKTRDSTYVLIREFNYLGRHPDTVIPVEEIHRKVCKLDENGNALFRDDLGKLCLDEGYGAIVYQAITEIISSYEYIALGIHHGIFDDEYVYALAGSQIIKARSAFREYILH